MVVKSLVVANQTVGCIKRAAISFVLFISVMVNAHPTFAEATGVSTEIQETNFPYVAALARASILADYPVTPTTQKVSYQFEIGVPIENQNMIKEAIDKSLSHFGNLLNYSDTEIGVLTFKTLEGGKSLVKNYLPYDSKFQADMDYHFSYGKVATAGIVQYPKMVDGFSVNSKKLIVLGAPYFYTSNPMLPSYDGAPMTTPHEIAHLVASSVSNGQTMRFPVWLCEGSAQVIGATMSVYLGKDYWQQGRDYWSKALLEKRSAEDTNITVSDLKTMESETTDQSYKYQGSEYKIGAALSEYLIAKGGFAKYLSLNQSAFNFGGGILAFRSAYQSLYNQNLDDFYAEALPYVNYVATNPKSEYASSSAALSFIVERMGATKAAQTIAEAPRIITELKAKQNADAVLDLLPMYLSEGCHAGSRLNATLQKLDGATWIDVAEARKWELTPICSLYPGTQYQPSTNADIAAGTQIRWHVTNGTWDWYSSIRTAFGTPTETLKAVADLKAKQSYELLSPADKAAADKATNKKLPLKTTITCTKGKLTKKVTAIRPTCPARYKKK